MGWEEHLSLSVIIMYMRGKEGSLIPLHEDGDGKFDSKFFNSSSLAKWFKSVGREISSTLVTSKSSTVVVEDFGEFGYVVVVCRQRVVRISGVDCGVGQVEEHRATGVVIVDQSNSLLREHVRRILAVEVPGRLQSSPHVQSPIRLRSNGILNFFFFFSCTD